MKKKFVLSYNVLDKNISRVIELEVPEDAENIDIHLLNENTASININYNNFITEGGSGGSSRGLYIKKGMSCYGKYNSK